ncbi:MAG: UDP-N-acetylmuramoyl-L-alanine--D-glutamate ligase [Chloroflexota bacterium]
MVIVGAARQGLALARYLLQHGAVVVLNDRRSEQDLQAARQTLSDLALAGAPLAWVCGGHPLEILDGTDLLCVSGGVPLNLPLIAEARQRGIPLSNDSQIFMEAVPCKVIGITGSAGKTTTTTLVGRMAQAALQAGGSEAGYRKVWVGGNIGAPLIAVVDEMQPDDLAVMELSSFQLEIMNLSPQVAAVLNVTPNHLDRHGTMAAYLAAKAQIIAHQSPSDVVVLGRDDPGAWSLAKEAHGRLMSFGLSELAADQEGVFLRGREIILREGKFGSAELQVLVRDAIALRGEHNLLNVMAACAIAAAAGLPVEATRAGVQGFAGVKHRLEFVRTWHGVDWYNDSIASAPERVMADIRSFDEPLVLLAGGRDKNLPWDELAALVRQRVDHLVVFGEAAELIVSALHLTGEERLTVSRCSGLQDAVQQAAGLAQPGDVVLLSPGGTSFDEFKDFEERGECFVQWVNQLP